jgi:hypothetical protein
LCFSVRSVTYDQQILRSCFLIQFPNLCVLMRESRSFTCSPNIKRYAVIPAILFFVCVCMCGCAWFFPRLHLLIYSLCKISLFPYFYCYVYLLKFFSLFQSAGVVLNNIFYLTLEVFICRISISFRGNWSRRGDKEKDSRWERRGCEMWGLQVNKTLVCRHIFQLLWRRVLLSKIAEGQAGWRYLHSVNCIHSMVLLSSYVFFQCSFVNIRNTLFKKKEGWE